MDIMAIIIQVVSGLIGGNAVGAAGRGLSLGPIVNSVIGAIGGLAGGQIAGSLMGGAGDLAATAEAAGGLDIGTILTQIAAGGLGGGALMAIVGIVKKMMAR